MNKRTSPIPHRDRQRAIIKAPGQHLAYGSAYACIRKLGCRKADDSHHEKGHGLCHATYVAMLSCPDTCPHLGSRRWTPEQGLVVGRDAENKRDGTCYVTNTHGVDFVAKRLHEQVQQADTAQDCSEAEAAVIDLMPATAPLRGCEMGDVSDAAGARKLGNTGARYKSRFCGPKGDNHLWRYTHRDIAEVPRESWQADDGSDPWSVLYSCETVSQVKRNHAAGGASALVVDEHDGPGMVDLGDGFRGLPCPQQTGKAQDCYSCRACFQDQRLHATKTVILFAAHGKGKRSIQERLAAIGG